MNPQDMNYHRWKDKTPKQRKKTAQHAAKASWANLTPQQRSERAAKAYETRLKNKARKEKNKDDQT